MMGSLCKEKKKKDCQTSVCKFHLMSLFCLLRPGVHAEGINCMFEAPHLVGTSQIKFLQHSVLFISSNSSNKQKLDVFL